VHPCHFVVKKVRKAGTIRCEHKTLLLARPLRQHLVGSHKTGDRTWSIYFSHVLLAAVDERDMIVRG